jgi:hexosaminidase
MKEHDTTNFKDVYIHFERMLHATAAKHGKAVQTWADAFRAVNNASSHGQGTPLPASAIAQEWGNWDGNGHDESGKDEVKDVVRSGGRAVRSSGFYFSGGYSTGGTTTVWEQIINAQIIPPGLSADEQARVLGAEACMW